MRQISIKNQKINIVISSVDDNDYISLTDIARIKNSEDPNGVIANWIRNHDVLEFLGLWESLYNSDFKPLEFEGFKIASGHNSFTLSPTKWINTVSAVGIKVSSGRYSGGTFAHKDIAFEFASWISAEVKLYIIREFQRLKKEESEKFKLGWNVKRELTKINYRYHTDAIKNHLILPLLTKKEVEFVYADEADLLNVVLFGKTAQKWRDENSSKSKNENIRDYANYYELIALSNLETLNAEYIKMKKPQPERMSLLRKALEDMYRVFESSHLSIKKIG